MKLVEPIAKLVYKITKLSLHSCKFIVPKEYIRYRVWTQVQGNHVNLKPNLDSSKTLRTYDRGEPAVSYK
jgi:hypothetical protein